MNREKIKRKENQRIKRIKISFEKLYKK